MIILGIDPGYAIVGFGILSSQQGRPRLIRCGAINTPAGVRLSARLWQIARDLEELIGPRSRAITRKLESVQQLDPDAAADLLGIEEKSFSV